MTSFTVHTPALAAAALAIGANANSVGDANSAAQSASGAAGAFGGEPIGSAFMDMCSRAQTATQALHTTMQELSHNVAAASVGYLVTDQGIVPTKALPGFKP
jgi:hypothetical protein